MSQNRRHGAAHGPQSGEDRLIARFFRPLAKHPGAFALVDDAAALAVRKGSELVLTVDAVVGDVHFFSDDPPGQVAKKALRVNLSDLAAKGARPAGFLLTLALPKSVTDRWLSAFAKGLGDDADRFDCPLLGGDTVRTPGPLTISVTAFGVLPKDTMVRRTGARAGDRVMVSGTIGDAALGLRLRQDKAAAKRWRLSSRERAHLAGRYLLPQPRNALAEAVRRHASGAMDISDGLAGDLIKLCKASGVGAAIEIDRVPLSKAARRVLAAEPGMMETALTGGDDYEILCTVAPKRLASFCAAAAAAGVAVAEIGTVTRAAQGVRFLGRDGRAHLFKRASFSHF